MKEHRVVLNALLTSCLMIVLLSTSGEAKTKVLVVGISDQELTKLQQAVPEIELYTADRDELLSKVAAAEGLIGTCEAEVVKAGRKLKWVQVGSAGVSYCMYPELVESDITLTNAKIIQGPEIADHAMALLLFLTRNLGMAADNMKVGDWDRGPYFDSVELRGKTALVVGVGGIGTQVAERASSFGMRVMGIDPKDISYINSMEKVGKPDELRSFLPSADVVFMCAPITPESNLMLGSEEFSLMKKGAYFVNVSRGKIVDTQALLDAVQSQHLAGVGLDVTEPEPLPQDHPLWKQQNVIITPHIAGRSDGIGRRRLELYEENLKRFAHGLPLRNVVDKQKGY